MAEVLGVVASAIAVVDISAKVLNFCGQYLRYVKNAKSDIEIVEKEVAGFQTTTYNLQVLFKGPRGKALEASRDLYDAINDARSTLAALAQNLTPSKSREAISRVGLRALKWPFKSNEVDEIIHRLVRCRGIILLALNVDQIVLIQNVDHNIVLDKLPVAESASFDSHAQEHSPTCLPNTRVELLKHIFRWVEDPNSKTIFWLNGMAGTGKSTISRTVAYGRSGIGDLGASFFFKRGEADRGNLTKLMTTLAHQLALRVPGVAHHIKDAVDADPGICGKTVREQFEKLVNNPLSKAFEATSGPSRAVIVIDALDECERDEDIRLLTRLLSHTTTLRSRLRVLVTSRPELPIRLGFSQVRDAYQDLLLHDIPSHFVDQDIYTFLASEFDHIRNDFNSDPANDGEQIPPCWPGRETLRELTRMAVPLFIFAATLCRFIKDSNCGSPLNQLRKSKRDKDRIIKDFKIVVGTIVTLANPLPIKPLSRLIDTDPDVVKTRLRTMHSVLNVPSNDLPVRLFHLSFRDYLVDPDQKETNVFWVDQRAANQTLARNCLRVMAAGLRENICNMSYPGMRRSAVDSQCIDEALPPEVQYACRFWAYHWTAAEFRKDDGLAVYGLLKEHLLHWLEAMSLMGCAREVIGILRLTASWIEERDCQPLSSFLVDAVRFVKASFSAIDETPLQVYSSALVFAPSRSIIRSTFEKYIPDWLSVGPQGKENWAACLAVLEGHASNVSSVVFSHDSKTVASASWDNTVRIWDAESGDCMWVLKGHDLSVTSVVFSHDSKTVASASHDETVRIWDAESGDCVQVIQTGPSPLTLRFTADDSGVITNTGVIPVTRKSCTAAIKPPSSAALRLALRDSSWITSQEEQL
ncbi:hypothetical protein VdG2_09694 [Verticillium dahliae VDG2]|nr:hypothetical protein VdG2_09694 [Verticillium dahliae VDG2]